MKKLLTLLAVAFFLCNIYGQTDTVFTLKGDTIAPVKITKVTTTTVWYTQKNIGKSIPVSDVKRQTYGVTISQLDTNGAGRQIKYSDLSKEDRAKGKFDSYVSKDGFAYSVGDTIRINSPSGTNGKFVYIQKMTIGGEILIVGPEASNTFAVIKKIYVGGTKRSGWKVYFQTKGFTVVDNYFFPIEDCIISGEVKSSIMTSDQALAELKRYKDKLDLGLISQEEYDKKKAELTKFIK